MINGLVSINVVLQEAIRDLGLGETLIPLNDMKEWVTEALKHIGVQTQFRQEQRAVTIENYTGKLPCETYKVVSLINGYLYNRNINLVLDDDTDYAEQIKKVAITEADYNIQFHEVITSFKEGVMYFNLLLLPLDKDGFILVPDSVSYKDAIMWKLAYQMRMRGHKFPIPELNSLEYLYNKWSFYCLQARGQARMPDKEMMELLKNEFHRLIINPQSYESNFAGLGQPESLVIDKNRIQ